MASTDEGYQIPDELKVAGDTRWLNKSEWCQSVQAYMSGALSVLASTPTIVGFDSEDYDSNLIHDTAVNNSRLTCVVRGVYEISAYAVWVSDNTGVRIIRIKVNTTGIRDSIIAPVSGDRTYHLLTTKKRLAYGDYVEMEVEQTTAGAINLEAGTTNTYFGMCRIA